MPVCYKGFGVDKALGVLVNLNSGIQEFFVVGLGSYTYQFRIALRRNQQIYIHSGKCRYQ